jgi:GT2 family glycosyltransferase/glycosyltransferase involved in cell wall biosynthesis
MRITFVLPGIDISGGVKSTFELANRLHQRGHEVIVVYSLTSWRFENKFTCLRTIRDYLMAYPKTFFTRPQVKWFDLKVKLMPVPSLAERHIPKGDIIVATWWGNVYDVNSYKADKGEKFHFIRSYEIWCGPEELVNNCFFLPLHKIAVSKNLKDFIEDKFKVPVYGPLPNGLDFSVFYKEKQDFECNAPKRVGLLYRKDKIKGSRDGLAAMIEVQKKFPDTKIVIFGETPTDDDSQLIKKIDNVEFYQLPFRDKLRHIYNSLDIFVFPSRYVVSGSGNPPMEAMACGVACITTNIGAAPDYIVAGETALVSQVENPEDLAKNIVRLLKNEKERKQIAENGYNYIKQFIWDETVLKLENIFEDCIDPKPSTQVDTGSQFLKLVFGFLRNLFPALLILNRGLYWLLFGRNRKKLAKIWVTYKAGGLKLCWHRAAEHFATEKYFHYPHNNQLSKQQCEYLLANFADKPMISIVVPVYKVSPEWLDRCIDSVCCQYYRNWEIILVDDASGSQQLTELMRSWALKDERIRMYALEANSGIAVATSFGIKQARGKFVGFLDHDDELTPDALTWMIWAINKHPQAQWFYSDEDKISENGCCHSPYFKPDFSPELLLANMYTCHLSIYSKQILNQAGGLRQGFEGAQDHDLALRISEIVPKERIIHIPRVLYHWRIIPGSAAMYIGEKPLAPIAGRKAVEQALARRNIQGEVVSNKLCPTLYQIKLKPAKFPKVSIIIPTRDSLFLLKKCLESLRKYTDYPNYEIIIVDNQSKDTSFFKYMEEERLKRDVKIIRYDKPFNHSDINNMAIRSTDSEFIVFMNNDIEILTEKWLEQLVATAQQDGSIAVVGALLLYPNRTVQHGGIILGLNGTAGHAHKYIYSELLGYNCRLHALQEFSGITAALALVRRSSFECVGGFDSNRYPTLYNDVDLCIRLRAQGCRCIYNPMVRAIHYETKTRPVSSEELVYKQRLARDYAEILNCDPFYNPNLALNNEQFRGFRQFPVEEQIPELANMPEKLS